jgi:hypothetical protein
MLQLLQLGLLCYDERLTFDPLSINRAATEPPPNASEMDSKSPPLTISGAIALFIIDTVTPLDNE